jgi:hypothetical protein
LRFAHPRHRLRQAWIVSQRLLHQAIELRILERIPPRLH